MQINTYLNFNGNCQAAFKFYAKALGGKITMMTTQGESPMGNEVATEMKNKIMDATLETPGGGILMGADHPQGKKAQPTGQKTFWSPGFGMCTDKFEIPWMVNCATAT